MVRKIVIATLVVVVGGAAIAAGVLFGGESMPEPPAVSAADKKAVVDGNTAFAVDLYHQLRERDGNLFYSPYSTSTALAMTSLGANGKTLTQMQQVLHHRLEPAALHPAMHALTYQVKHGHGPKWFFDNLWGAPGYEVSVANSLWGDHGAAFHPDFLNQTQANYQAGMRRVDFAGDTENARAAINRWVARETNQKIKDVLQPGTVSRLTRLVLANAIYFKGDWDQPFYPESTTEQPWLGAARPAQVQLMHRKAPFAYLDGGSFQAVSLPYAGKELSMVVFVPNAPDGLAAFEKELTAAKLTEWTTKLAAAPRGEAEVLLPRFKMNAGGSLKPALQALGMKDAFEADAANLSAMSPESLYIDDVIHQAFVEVNEKGTEAAAATLVTVFGVSLAEERQAHPIVRADRPFFFVIRDDRSGSILFAGRLTQPE